MTERIANLLQLPRIAVFLLLALSPILAHSDQPQTRAARLTFLMGSVTVQSADNTSSQPAALNVPLLAGVRVATGSDGQAEIEFEDGSLVRLTPNSVLSLDTLTVDGNGVFSTGLSLLRGLAYAELRATSQYRYSIDAGGDVLTPVENTTARIDFDETPPVFSVVDGTAHISGSLGFSVDLPAGNSLRSSPNDPSHYALFDQVAPESWDQWNLDRDQVAAAESTSRTSARDSYAGAQGYGWSDLDANGSWYQVPGQGPIWQPSVATVDADFDPYANGAWVYYPSTGYVWASAYSWGWTPYRCGGWSYYNSFGWGWAPTGCGGYGWGFYPAGGYVNILLGPRGYQPVRVPRPRPGPVQPILPVRLIAANRPPYIGGQAGGGVSQLRQIDGRSAYQILPIASGYTAHGSSTPVSALQRDFPVDSTTRTPVLGRPSSQPPATQTSNGWRPAATRPAPSTTYQPSRPQPSTTNRPAPTQTQRPAYTPPPASHPAPAPAHTSPRN